MKYKIKFVCTTVIECEADNAEEAEFKARIKLQHTPLRNFEIDINNINAEYETLHSNFGINNRVTNNCGN